jgi:hypothetical protein
MKTSTTVKIEKPLHERLLKCAKKTGLKMAVALRLSADIGLPQVEKKFAEMRKEAEAAGGMVGEVPVVLRLDAEQLVEMRELYKSAVTDSLGELDRLNGAELIAAATKALDDIQRETVMAKDCERARRFLAVYAQLF